MTWGEFKAAVEGQGVTDCDVLAFIDVNCWGLLCVERNGCDDLEIIGYDDR